jgi:hypothetical protein
MIERGREAKIFLGDAHYDILQSGDHVLCSVSGQKISLPNLRYWSVDLQEVYATSEISLNRVLAMKKKVQQ